MRVILLSLLLFSLYADDSFITPDEYARQLYHNPRGIGCHLCHGESGEGRDIADYEEKGKKMSFLAPAIYGLDLATFSEALKCRKRAMPRYFLTDTEIKALYEYLHPREGEE